MFETIFWGVLIVTATYYFSQKYYWFRDLEDIFRREAGELSKYAEDDHNFAQKFSSELYQNQAKKSKERLKKFIETHEKYLRLKEKYRHDGKKRLVHQDWIIYLKSIQTFLDCRMDYAMLDNSNLLSKTGDKENKAEIAIQEIEKRFNRYLED